MVRATREDFFIESKENPIGYGTYYTINQKYGDGFQWTSAVHHDFIITLTDIRFHQEVMIGERVGAGYVLALYISGAGDEFYPYQIVSPNTLRCYEPSEKYKAIYHPQIALKCMMIHFDPEFIDQYLQENFGEMEVSFSDFFKTKGKFSLPTVNQAMHELYEYLLTNTASRIYVEAKIYEIVLLLAAYLTENKVVKLHTPPISATDMQALEECVHYLDEHYSFHITLQTLSTIACMSESKLKKIFKAVYHVSITEYIQRKRISAAEHMLIQTDLTIAEIAKIVGYSNPSRLIEIFKRYYGFTPSKYRE